MRIDRIHVHRALLPVVGEPYRTSQTTVHELDSTLVEVVTDDGRRGWGETCPLGPVYQPHHALGARAGLAQIAPGLVGTEIDTPRALARRMDGLLAGHGYVKAALDTAVFDLLGQQLGVPVSTLLGGALVDRVPAYQSVIVGDPEDSARSAAAAVAAGYPRVQVKIGGRDLARDVETAHRVWEAVGYPHLRRRVGRRGDRRRLPPPRRHRRAALLEGVWIAQEHIDGHDDPHRPVVVQEGHLAVPQGPGLGVAPDPASFIPVATYGG